MSFASTATRWSGIRRVVSVGVGQVHGKRASYRVWTVIALQGGGG